MEKLLELEKKLIEYIEELEKADSEYGSKVDISDDKLVHPSKDNGNDDYDYRVHSKTGEVHKLMLEGEHKGKFIPMGHDVNNSKLKKSIDERLDAILEKAIREPTVSSPSAYENPTNVEGAAKEKKYQGGDPRHKGIKTRAGNYRERGHQSFTSGSSSLRSGTKLDEYKRETTNDTTGKKIRWGKSEAEQISLSKNGQWNLEKAIEIAPEGSKNRESYEKEFKKKEKKHEDEKEDKKMIAEALDVHNEKKHGEAKDKDSALKDAGLKKSIDERLDAILEKGLGSKLDNAESKERVKQALGSIRQPAKVTDSEGNVSEVSPAKQVSDKAAVISQKKDAAKMKAESEATARRASYKKQGLMKNNLQWTLEFESLEKGGGALKAAIDTFNRKVTPKHIKYAKDAGHAYAHIDHPAANVEFKNPKHQEKFDDHVNGWLSGHDTSGSKEHPHDY